MHCPLPLVVSIVCAGVLAAQVPAGNPSGRRVLLDAQRPARSIVSHGEPFTEEEPTLRDFFERIRPVATQALAPPSPRHWPTVTLNLDFKDSHPEHFAAIWDLLGEFDSWLTTAPRFYTRNGHPASQGARMGWSPGYNFGSLDAARVRWRAAIAAGADFIATDQYEAFSQSRCCSEVAP